MTTTPAPLLFSYVPCDRLIHDQLRRQLEPLTLQGMVALRSSHHMRSEGFWPLVARLCLSSSQIYVPLLSPEFIACPAKHAELERALRLVRDGKLLILPLVVRPLELDATPLAGYRPVTRLAPVFDSASCDHRAPRALVSAIRQALGAQWSALEATPAQTSSSPTSRILAAFASPPHGVPLNVGYEGKTIAQALGSNQTIELERLPAASFADIHAAISSTDYDTVHLSCHHERGRLALANLRGSLAVVEARTLAEMLVRHGVRNLVFNACNSANLADELPGFERLVLMRGAIVDDDAIAFSRYFYRSLASNSSFSVACADGYSGIRVEHDSARPMLVEAGREVLFGARAPSSPPPCFVQRRRVSGCADDLPRWRDPA